LELRTRYEEHIFDDDNSTDISPGFGTITLEELSLSGSTPFKIPLFLNSKKVGELKGTISLQN